MELAPHCRICRSPEDPVAPLQSIYSTDDSVEITKMMEEIVGTQLITDDHRSSEICPGCLKNVRIGYDIQRQIREAETTPVSPVEIVLSSGTVVKVEDVLIEEEDEQYEYEYLEDEYLEEQTEESAVRRVAKGRFFIMPKEEVVRGVVDHPEGYREVQVEGDRCCGCSFVGVNRKELLLHSDKAHVIEIVESGNYCPICFGKFAQEETLTRHIDECRSRSIFVCLRCNRYFNRRGKIEKHLVDCEQEQEVIIPGEEIEESDTMVIEFESASEWEEEQLEDKKESESRKKITAKLQNVLDVRFSEGIRIDDLKESQIVTRMTFQTFLYVKLRGERCCGCDFYCETRDELFQHAREVHEASAELESLLKCSICCLEFEDNRKLQQHVNFSTSKELLICTICEEAFSGSGHLLYHQEASISHKDLCVEQNAPILEVKDKTIQEELLHLSSGDKDPTRLRNNNRSITRHRHLTIPEPTFITAIDDFPNYQVITVSGERCCGCGQFFQTFQELVEHGRHEHLLENPEAIGGYQCDICFSRFMWDRGLILHQTTRRSLDKIYHCTICNLVFSKLHSITKHLQSAPNHCLEEPFEVPKPTPNQFHCCFPKCPQTFPSEDLLIDHTIADHSGKRRENESERTQEANICMGCLKSFENTTNLVWHRTTRFTKRYRCRFCSEEFSRWPAYREHENVVHLGKRAEFPCETCGKIFRSAYSLKAHSTTHSQVRSEVCGECGAAFRNRGVLKRHKRAVHASEFRFECSECGKKFPNQEQMLAHGKIHSSVKPYPCRFCVRAFKHFTDRKRHEMSTHTGERPYKCPHCSASYIRNRELVIHLQKHSEVPEKGSLDE